VAGAGEGEGLMGPSTLSWALSSGQCRLHDRRRRHNTRHIRKIRVACRNNPPKCTESPAPHPVISSANRWNTSTIGRAIICRSHSQGATNPVENAILWRWRAPLGLLWGEDQVAGTRVGRLTHVAITDPRILSWGTETETDCE